MPLTIVLALVALMVSSWPTLATAAPFAYITNYTSDTVSVLDTATNMPQATVPVGSFPFAVAVNPSRTRVYVGNFLDGTVSVIDTETNAVVTTVTVGGLPMGVAASPTGDRVYVANSGDDTVSVIDTTTQTVTATITGLFEPQGLAVSPNGTRLYVANCDANNVSVIDTATYTIVATIPVGDFAQGVAIKPDGSRVYVTNLSGGTVSVINTATNTVVATVTVGDNPFGVAVHPAGTFVYVANSGSDSVSVIDTTTNAVVATVPLPVNASPTGLAVNPLGTRVYVANTNLNSVSVIDTATNAVVPPPIPVGSNPMAFGDFIGPGATHLSVSAPASATAGTAIPVTVSALDQYGRVDTGYTGTVHFTSSDGQAILPANTTLTNGTGTFNATLKTPGNQTITATDTVTSAITGTSGTIAVSAGAATHFTVSAPGSAAGGTAFAFTVTALDQFDNTATGYAGTVHFTSSDAQATLPANATLTNGTGTFNATLKTAGSQTITATDTVNATITGTSGVTVVSAATATHFTVSAPASAAAGTVFAFTVTALDQFNNTVTGYAGIVRFTSTDPQATLPANATLTNGTGSFAATLRTAGGQTLTATDTGSPSVTGTSGTITVSSAATATHFSVTAPTSAVAGTALSFTVSALDPFNNVVTGYSGVVHFTSSDGAATLPANATLENGTKTFSATLRTPGGQTLTATDLVHPAITGTSGPIAVSASGATRLQIGAPASAVAGTAFSFTVTALDQFNNTVTSYSGTVHFTSTDPHATLPANATLTNGVGTFNATLRTAGSQTLTGRDTVTPSITGTSTGIVVSPAPATHFALSAPGSAVGGVAFSVTVTALDAFGNVAAAYAGTVHFTSSDPLAILPAAATLTGGVGTFSVTLRSPGSQTVTATDTVTASITGSVTIAAAAAAIPTLGTWAFAALTALLALVALKRLADQRAF